jgi:stage V sporulation protein B
MFFIAVSNILKGYFFGVSKISIPSFIDILEKALRIFILASLIYFLKAKSLSALVTVAYFSLCIGELQSLILLFIYYKRTIRNVPKVYTKTERRPQLLFDVLIISLPLALNSFLTSIFSTTSTLIVPRRLMASGLTYSEALAMIGKFNGMAFVIVTFPIIVISSINSLLIPDLSQTMGSKDYFNASNRIKQVIKIAFLLGLCTFILCQLIPDSLGYMFFTRNDLGSYIKAASYASPILFPAISMFGILNGLGKQGIIVRNSLIIEIVEISSLFILTSIPSINIYGIAITAVITSAIGLTINLREVNKVISLEFSYINILIYIFIGILAYLSIGLLLNFFATDTILIKNLIVMALIGALFIFLLFASRRLGED